MVTDARGAALIDVVAACGLCSVLAAMAVPLVGGTLERERALVGARVLAGQLQRARLASLGTARAVAVRLLPDEGGVSLQLFADGNGNGVSSRDIERGIDPPLAPAARLEQHARDVSLRINQPIVEVDGTRALSPGDDPIRIGNTTLVSFSPLGSSTSGTVYIAAQRGPQLAIRVFGGTGRVRVLQFDARARQWRP